MNTGENEQGLRKVIDLTRMISIVLLLLHCYFYCYTAFKQWNCTAPVGDRILSNLAHTGLFTSFHKSKWIATAFLLLSLVGVKGRKSEKMSYRKAFAWFITGCIIYFLSAFCFNLFSSATTQAIAYITCTVIGYILILTGAVYLQESLK